jgi:hypothetical protein
MNPELRKVAEQDLSKQSKSLLKKMVGGIADASE